MHLHYTYQNKTQKTFSLSVCVCDATTQMLSHSPPHTLTLTHFHCHSDIRIQENFQRFYLIFNLITGKSLVDVVAVVCGEPEHTTNFVRIFCLFLCCIIYKIVFLCRALFISGMYRTRHFHPPWWYPHFVVHVVHQFYIYYV